MTIIHTIVAEYPTGQLVPFRSPSPSPISPAFVPSSSTSIIFSSASDDTTISPSTPTSAGDDATASLNTSFSPASSIPEITPMSAPLSSSSISGIPGIVISSAHFVQSSSPIAAPQKSVENPTSSSSQSAFPAQSSSLSPLFTSASSSQSAFSNQSFNSTPTVSTGPANMQSPNAPQTSVGGASLRAACSSSAAVIAGSVVGSILALRIGAVSICVLLHQRRARSQRFRSQLIATPLMRSFILQTDQPENNASTRQEKESPPVTGSRSRHQTLPDPQASLGIIESEGTPAEQVEARLMFLQNVVTQMMEHMNRLKSQIEYEEGSTYGRSGAAPPTYESG
ncbi:hypothetical protein GYMLUDRAFT_265718 [Collybiopsis luxurians FD-317 M1]|uniref:Uncharacterized protein n=1 Tax=Collybiopsis luxurians FD-317 M1 TaxID=944289 RepID=A0A0D0BBC4_9AGAR|nr:hypothetical protein GYMLUDRAFT_265718 [Collybiopsis luxurians FD-317 M1]